MHYERVLNGGRNFFSKYFKFVIGDGSHFHFWCDPWRMDCSLKDLFPYLFRLTMEKGASITMNLARYTGLEFSIDSTFSRLGIRVCGGFFFFFCCTLIFHLVKERINYPGL